MPVGPAGNAPSNDQPWIAKWCWPVARLPRPWNTYAYFRRSIELAERPASAVVRISADARYTLFVNGRRVHQGPARSHPHLQSYDTLDLADLLTAGPNAIGAVVHQFGVPTAQSVYRDASGFLLDGAVETGEGGRVELHTPTGWLCREAAGWRKHVARLSPELGFQEHFDADADPADWMSPEYVANEEGGWRAPLVVAPVGGHPWLAMRPRAVPLLADQVTSFVAVVAHFGGENARGYKVAEDVYQLPVHEERKKARPALENAPALLRDDDQAATLPPPPDGEFYMAVLDLGLVRTGHVILDIVEAAGDEILDVLYLDEVDKGGGPALSAGGEAPGDRYRCRPGAQRWEAFWPKAFRYAAVVFRNVERPLRIRHVGVRTVHASVPQVGSFESSDERLNAVYKAAVETLCAGLLDAWVDRPRVGQAQRWSAALAQARGGAYVFGDVSLVERGIVQVAQSQAADGSLHAYPPSDDPHGRQIDSMFAWVVALWEHHFQSGRLELLRQSQGTLDRLLEFFGRHEKAEGLIAGLEGFEPEAFELTLSGPSAALNLLYLQALQSAARVYEVLGEEKEGAWAAKKGESLTRAIEKHFWDAKARMWKDGFDAVAGTPVEQGSVYANALAVLLRVKPETGAAVARDVIFKTMSSRRGRTAVAPPALAGAALDALVEMGLRTEALDLIRSRWGGMLDRGATTFWEHWDGATGGRCCGSAAASPVYVLAQQALGVTPAAVGWTRVRIAPLLGTLEFARGVVPSPLGPIRVEWEKAGDDQLAARVELPDGVSGEFVGPLGETRELEGGASEFHT